VLFVSQKLQVTRSHLVRTFRDKEGGGHLDDQLNRDVYLSMSRKTWTSHIAGNQRSLCWGLRLCAKSHGSRSKLWKDCRLKCVANKRAFLKSATQCCCSRDLLGEKGDSRLEYLQACRGVRGR